ncbi:hypothetical protein [Croceicoccus naphthovorans]|uniref:Uncharacterized protein n=1 Tax=Croceicoccus naphthovorans TaxID=1348774 RepID=A0A0G3XEY9_9SPHN|nr:hypothetical protein [Croceicoccus naphthovorans]AKM09164.1 hypothetical protein AB433_02950 [Croceicoccus naphthovorans]MBB3990470.1 hypothetical protein [Croceicoccus naphthovorans]
MKTAKILVAAAMAALIASPAAAAKKDPETRLAEKLEGRVAGDPVKCIDLNRVRSSTIYEDTAIVFDMGSTLYVNRPENGTRSLDRNDIMVMTPFNHRLCDIDTVQMHDSSGFWSGVVFLGDFVPYKKAS